MNSRFAKRVQRVSGRVVGYSSLKKLNGRFAGVTARTVRARCTEQDLRVLPPLTIRGRKSIIPPPPTDIDPQLTDVLHQLEQELGEAALHGFRDTKTMERLVSSEYTLRVADDPERTVPRSQWGQPSSKYKVESFEERYHAARKFADNLAAISLILTQKASLDGRDRSGDFYLVDIWKKNNGDQWQLIARYSCPVDKKFERATVPNTQ